MYSGDSETRMLIDTLKPGETFILGGLAFRVQADVPRCTAPKRYPPSVKPYERTGRTHSYQFPERRNNEAGKPGADRSNRRQIGGDESWQQLEMTF